MAKIVLDVPKGCEPHAAVTMLQRVLRDEHQRWERRGTDHQMLRVRFLAMADSAREETDPAPGGHAGDCHIYAAGNARLTDGVCTCGYGLHWLRTHPLDRSQLTSGRRSAPAPDATLREQAEALAAQWAAFEEKQCLVGSGEASASARHQARVRMILEHMRPATGAEA